MGEGMMSGPEQQSIKAKPIHVRDVPHQCEEWFVNDSYCMKRITIHPHMRSSAHYHSRKREAFFVVSGELIVQREETLTASKQLLHDLFKAGDVVVIPPLEVHWWENHQSEPAVVIEASSHHEDDDAVKLKPSGPI